MRLLRGVVLVLCCAIAHNSPAEADMIGKTPVLKLNWEYPAGRVPATYLLVRLDDVEKEGGGFLGIRRSPSMADAMPDAMIWSGSIADGDSAGIRVQIRVPGEDVPKVEKGDRVALGLVEDRICICVRVPPADLDAAAARAWLTDQGCAAKP
jgi:hypothetical protein